jgi:hypothetical protein
MHTRAIPVVGNQEKYTLPYYYLFTYRTVDQDLNDYYINRIPGLKKPLPRFKELLRSRVVRVISGVTQGLLLHDVGAYNVKAFYNWQSRKRVHGEIIAVDSFDIDTWRLIIAWYDLLYERLNCTRRFGIADIGNRVPCNLR